MVFATHNVVSDPAFSRLDLISCRNLLIYLDHEAQKRVMPIFHYALREGGYLILGGAESVVNLERQFQAVSPKWRIFRRIGAARTGARCRRRFRWSRRARAAPGRRSACTRPRGVSPRSPSSSPWTASGPPRPWSTGSIACWCSAVRPTASSACPSGEIDAELLSMVREGLRAKVRSALHQAAKDGGEVVQTGRVKRNGDYYQRADRRHAGQRRPTSRKAYSW